MIDTADIIFRKEAHQYFYKGIAYRSVTERIEAVGFGPDYSHVDPAIMAYARRRGDMVDLALTYYYEGDLVMATVDEQIQGYVNAAFRCDQECPGPVVAIHPRLLDEEYAIAGTADLVRFVRGVRCLIDWKTGEDNPLQTWMYQFLWNRLYPTKPCYHRYGLRLRIDGNYRLKEHNDPDDGAAAWAIITKNEAEIERWREKYGHHCSNKS